MNLLRMILKMTGGAMVFAGGSGFGLWQTKKKDRDPAGACAGADPSVWGSGVCGGRYGGDLSEAFRKDMLFPGIFREYV